MMRLATEEKLTLKQARKLFEGSPTSRTIRNYVVRGLYIPEAGVRVFLEGYRGPGMSWITSKQAVQRFCERMNGGGE